MGQNETARLILDAARSLLDEGGMAAMSMRKIADRVGITAMAIYRHFPDHQALANAVADHGFAELAATLQQVHLEGGIEQRLMTVSELYLDHALANPRLFELMFLARRAGARQYPQDFKAGRSPTATLYAQLLEDGMRQGVFRADDFWEITFEMGALMQGLIMLWLGGRIDLDAADFHELYRRSLRRYIHGIHT
jgi:AcrR family transcriptional regulator